MSMRLLLVPVVAVAVLAGCVTIPTGPAVMVLPGSHKSFDQFRADEAACRDYAEVVIGGPNAGQAGNDAAAANAVAGAALGAAAGAIIGSVTGQAGNGAAIGAGTGLLFGSAAGSNAAGYSSYPLQRNYDVAYVQCMYARGNQVPGQVVYREARRARTRRHRIRRRSTAPGRVSAAELSARRHHRRAITPHRRVRQAAATRRRTRLRRAYRRPFADRGESGRSRTRGDALGRRLWVRLQPEGDRRVKAGRGYLFRRARPAPRARGWRESRLSASAPSSPAGCTCWWRGTPGCRRRRRRATPPARARSCAACSRRET